MEAYTGFALVYDRFMDNIPYDMWCEYLRKMLEKYHVPSGLVAELGCGTGNMAMRLCSCGYDMIGIDASEDMLAMARQKMEGSDDSPILYLHQDMRQLELYGTVAAVVSVCDSMNYLLEQKDLLQVFRLVNQYLDAGGMFIFDMKTAYYFEHLSENTIAENRQQASFLWDNFYDKSTQINQYDLTIYVSEALLEEDVVSDHREDEPELFFRFDETHFQRAYSLETVIELLSEAGMEFVAAYDAFTWNQPTDTSERIYVAAREGYQPEKYYTAGTEKKDVEKG